MGCTMNSNQVAISTTEGHCPIGEITGNRNIANSKIPVISCEGEKRVSGAAAMVNL
jgi:hypothetical protein